MKKTKFGISIVIPNFNGSKFLTECLSSLNKSLKKCPQLKTEVILVDNNSSDNSIQIFNQYLINSKIILNSANLGFAKAVNQGIKASKYEFVCLLNNDIVIDSNWFKFIFKVLKSLPNKISTITGTVLNKNGNKFESQGIKFFFSGKCLNINNQLPFDKSLIDKEPYEVWGSSGAFVIYRKKTIIKIGMFDPSFFAYLEDVDVSYRLRKLGYKTLLVPKALCFHYGGGTSEKMGNFRAKMTLINWLKFIRKNYTVKEIVQNLPGLIIERARNLSYFLKSSSII